ncbi:MAG: STAS domain-containing protein [Verrucomicrobiae bacterium]|nr:STAS domain-containing protein [Verrucomicrobiae bacterium]
MSAAVCFQPDTRKLVVTVGGPVFEAKHAAALEGDLLPFADQEVTEIAFDLCQVEEIDSTAVQALIHLHHSLAPSPTDHSAARIGLNNLKPAVRRVLDLLGWERQFCIADDYPPFVDAGAASMAS